MTTKRQQRKGKDQKGQQQRGTTKSQKATKVAMTKGNDKGQ
jgi:hypothetical protein